MTGKHRAPGGGLYSYFPSVVITRRQMLFTILKLHQEWEQKCSKFITETCILSARPCIPWLRGTY